MPIKAYYLDNGAAVDETVLRELGVLTWQLNPATYDSDGSLKAIRDERNYTYADEVNSDKIEDLDAKLEIFYREHLHDDEEIRYFIAGSGYFDVRDEVNGSDADVDGGLGRWLRIHCFAGDMIVLPAGIFHRFAADERRKFHVLRLFQGEPVWTPHNRDDPATADKPSRYKYTKAHNVQSGPVDVEPLLLSPRRRGN